MPQDQAPDSPGAGPGRERVQRDVGVRALTVSLAWMFLVQLACVALWDAGWMTREAALMHWLALGVLPPALALWSSGPVPRQPG
ncbi:MAG: hypothetical protein K2X91_00190 [Thermoleophilia bacterium]|nr:hypothetical protein [Thermoleophilia bacterium]